MMDYHIHSDFSFDGRQTIEQICESAKNKGLDAIAITDHIDIEYPYPDMIFDFDKDKRNQNIKTQQSKYSDIAIANGVEIGLMHTTLKQNRDYANDSDFDFIIASVHIVDNIDPYFSEFFENRTKEEAYIAYFKEILACLEGFDLYSVVGHLNYPSRFCQEKDSIIRYDDYADLLDEILKKIISCGKGIEVNTNGIPSTGDTLPSKSIISRYKQLGGQIITIGSDAHTSQCVGDYVRQTQEDLKEIGFKYITQFKELKPYFIKI